MAEDFSLGGFLSDVATMAGFAANPVGSTISMVGSEVVGKSNSADRNEAQMAYQDPFSTGTGSYGSSTSGSSSGGSGGFFSTIGSTISDFGSDVGSFLSDIRPTAELFGINVPGGDRAPSGARTVIRQRPDETSMSGEILGANLGMAPALFQAGRSFLRTPGGQTALGFGGAAAGALLSGGSNGAPRITRKMKSDVRKIYMMSGMDPNATAQILNNLGTYPRINFNASVVFFILTKRFRNDGPVVTKAAVRKTKTTLRRMKGVVDMYNSVCKPTTRRAPARRAAPKAVQLIKN
jgi:hypothetical protein